METNFDDIEYRIKANLKRLEDEYKRFDYFRSRISVMVVIYAIYTSYSFQLLKYLIDKKYAVEWYYFLFFVVFVFCFLYSVWNTIHFSIPKNYAYPILPETFYKDMRKKYAEKEIPENKIPFYLRESYLKHIEKCVKFNFQINNSNSKFHYLAYKYAMFSLFPYLMCIGIKIHKEDSKDKVYKVEVTSNNKSNIMNKEDEKNEPSDETVDQEKVIDWDPVMIKGNVDPGTLNEGIPEKPKD